MRVWGGIVQLLKNVRVPTLIIVGTEDGNVDPETVIRVLAAKQTGAHFSNVEIHIIPGLEHSFRKIEPGESFVDAMGKPLSEDYIAVIRQYFANFSCEKLSITNES